MKSPIWSLGGTIASPSYYINHPSSEVLGSSFLATYQTVQLVENCNYITGAVIIWAD